jgi:hypothetical protein
VSLGGLRHRARWFGVEPGSNDAYRAIAWIEDGDLAPFGRATVLRLSESLVMRELPQALGLIRAEITKLRR